LGNPIHHVRDTEDPGTTLLRYLHRADRTREITARRHAIPQFVEAVLHIHPELLDRHPVGPSRPAVASNLQPRIPHQLLGDVIRLALQPRLTHAVPSLSVDHTRSPGRPRPFAPQPTATRRWITATTSESASAPASVLSPSRILPLGILPLTSPAPQHLRARIRRIVRAFTRSTQEPGPDSCCLYAGHHLGSKRISPRLIPGQMNNPGFDAN